MALKKMRISQKVFENDVRFRKFDSLEEANVFHS